MTAHIIPTLPDGYSRRGSSDIGFKVIVDKAVISQALNNWPHKVYHILYACIDIKIIYGW